MSNKRRTRWLPVKKGQFLMFGDGSTFYHPVHITNLVDAFELAANSTNGATGEAYNIADNSKALTR